MAANTRIDFEKYISRWHNLSFKLKEDLKINDESEIL